MRLFRILALLLIVAEAPALAGSTPGGFPVNPSQFPDPRLLLSDEVANAFTMVIGLGTDDRPYEPATALGTAAGLTLGFEFTFVGLPQSFFDTLRKIGFNGDTSSLTAVPVPRLQFHKGLGENIDLGLAFVGYQTFRIYGGDIKWIFWQPEEGATMAARFCYSHAVLGFVSTSTYTPQLLISRKLEWADPYAGIGLQKATGSLDIDVPIPNTNQTISLSKTGTATGFLAFTGVSFKIVGLQVVLEGAYSSVGVHTLGTKIGMAF